MYDPVIAADGHSYEAIEIKEWLFGLKNHDTSPQTGLKLAHKNTVRNHALREAVNQYRVLSFPHFSNEPDVEQKDTGVRDAFEDAFKCKYPTSSCSIQWWQRMVTAMKPA